MDGPANNTTTRSSSAESPVGIELTVADTPRLVGEGSPVTMTITSRSASIFLRAGLVGSEGVVVGDGLSYDGAAIAGQTDTLAGVVIVPGDGDHVLRAWAHAELGPGARAIAVVLLGIRVQDGQVTLFEPAKPNYDYALSLEPDSADPTLLHVRVVSPVDVPADLSIEGEGNFDVVEGNSSWSGLFEKGRSMGIDIRLAFPADGEYVVRAVLVTDPAVDGSMRSKAIYYTVENGVVTTAASPKRGTGTGPDPIAPTGEDAGEGGAGQVP